MGPVNIVIVTEQGPTCPRLSVYSHVIHRHTKVRLKSGGIFTKQRPLVLILLITPQLVGFACQLGSMIVLDHVYIMCVCVCVCVYAPQCLVLEVHKLEMH